MLAAWSGWGATPEIFDETDTRAVAARDRLRGLIEPDGWDAARRTVLNAHYTDPAVVRAMWDAAAALGFGGGSVLEPGCGSGNFLAFSPAGAAVVGVERDPTTAAIAWALYPDATIHTCPFEQFDPAQRFDLVIGNVPFAEPRALEPTCARSRRRFTGPAWSHAEPAFRSAPTSSICAVCTRRQTSAERSNCGRGHTDARGPLVTFPMDVAGAM